MLYINNEKLKQISLNYNNFAVLMDFDKTMTTINSVDSWTVLQNPSIVDPKLNIESNKLANIYYPIEMDYNLPYDLKNMHMYDWYSKVLDLYYKYGLTYDKLVSCVNCGNIILRNGLKDLLVRFYKYNIPVFVISAGIGNVIEQVLKLHDCFYDNISIMSNFFTFENDILLPFNNQIIHTCNKTIDLFEDNLKQKVLNKDYILLFGDFIEDLHMIPSKELNRTLSFGFLEKNVEANFDLYRSSFDVVLTNNSSFNDVNTLIDDLIKNKA